VITAGTHLAPSIKVAEGKSERIPSRISNIAFVKRLSKIFNLLNIDTQAVLEAAEPNGISFHFKPGLVGGHCIGVDPYLAQKSQEMGYHPKLWLVAFE
jgi:UDP-N-acetyl-D-galactosamine dehydrogenase